MEHVNYFHNKNRLVVVQNLEYIFPIQTIANSIISGWPIWLFYLFEPCVFAPNLIELSKNEYLI